MKPSLSTVIESAPAALPARIARAMSACVILAGRRGIARVIPLLEVNLRLGFVSPASRTVTFLAGQLYGSEKLAEDV
jgi:hypothetical protein